jgi:hypothetical protein
MKKALLIVAILLLSPSVFADAPIDIQHYKLDVHIAPEEHKFDVIAYIDFRAVEDTESATFFLSKDIELRRITDGEGNLLSFYRQENKVTVLFDEAIKGGEAALLRLEYSGVSATEMESGKFIWGYIGPEGGYMIYEAIWYPIIWGDRATAEVSISVPKGLTAVTVGELTGKLEDHQLSTFIWRTTTPTRGISFAVGNYHLKKSSTFIQDCPHKLVEISYYLYPDGFYKTEKSMKASSDILAFYSSAFGCYPYSRLSIVEIPEFFHGGHSDQGLVMLSAGLFRDLPSLEFLAHEIAHNWWGALVFAEGEPSLRSVEKFSIPLVPPQPHAAATRDQNYWLLEGFATYSGVMYLEEEEGKEAMVSSLKEKRKEYLGKIRDLEDQPITKVEEEYGGGLYHAVVYSKGAYVFHMLRYVVGDDAFFNIIREYARQYEGKSASVDDFQRICEEMSGRRLKWFFNQWVRGDILPDYAIGGVDISGQDIRVKILQLGDVSKMPIDVTLHTSKGDITKRIWVTRPEEEVSFKTDAKPISVEIDKEYWLLEADRSNNIYPLSYPFNLQGVKLLLIRLFSLLKLESFL